LWWGLALMASLTAISFEMLNSAMETLADHLHPEHHPKIGKMKDLAGGAVIVFSFGLLFIGIAMIMDTLWG